jgi:hypothetical protein
MDVRARTRFLNQRGSERCQIRVPPSQQCLQRQSRSYQRTRRQSSSVSNAAFCWSSHAEAYPGLTPSAPERSGKSGCSAFRNSPLPSNEMRPKHQICQNRVRSHLAVPAEKRSYVLSARITQESKTQGRRDLGAQIPGHERGRKKSRAQRNHRTCRAASKRQGRMARSGPSRARGADQRRPCHRPRVIPFSCGALP